MAFVDELIRLAATPPRLDGRPCVDCGEDCPDRAERQLLDVAALEARDGRLRDARLARQVHLSPATPTTERAGQSPEALIVHRADGGG